MLEQGDTAADVLDAQRQEINQLESLLKKRQLIHEWKSQLQPADVTIPPHSCVLYVSQLSEPLSSVLFLHTLVSLQLRHDYTHYQFDIACPLLIEWSQREVHCS